MTFLRAPLERSISHLAHLRRHHSDLSNLPAMEILERRRRDFENVQCGFLTDYITDCSDDELLNLARGTPANLRFYRPFGCLCRIGSPPRKPYGLETRPPAPHQSNPKTLPGTPDERGAASPGKVEPVGCDVVGRGESK